MKGKFNKKVLYNIILVVCICVFCFSAYKLIVDYLDKEKGKDAYEEINDVFVQNPDENSETAQEDETEVWVWNYAAALEVNKETKGWIKQGEILSYPILQTDNNDYYLTHLANKKTSKLGSVFIDCNIAEGFDARNCIIYGHNMKNKTMFGSLMGYYDESYYKEHPEFEIYIGDKHYIYEVFAAYETPEVSDTYTYSFISDDTFKDYLNTSRNKSLYKTAFRELTSADKIITLSTCTKNDDSKRFIVQLVKREEIL